MNNPTIPASDLIKLMHQTIKFPKGQVCKHLIACNIASLLTKHGVALSTDMIDALLGADDDSSLFLMSQAHEVMAGVALS